MPLGAVTASAACEIVTLHDAREAAALALGGDVDEVAGLEDVAEDLCAVLGRLFPRLEAKLPEDLDRSDVRLLGDALEASADRAA